MKNTTKGFGLIGTILLITILVGGGAIVWISNSNQQTKDVRVSVDENKSDNSNTENDVSTNDQRSDEKINAEEGSDNNVKYSVARTQNVPYVCNFKTTSFFGQRNTAEAEVLGKDFLIREYDGLSTTVYVQKDNQGYVWLEGEQAGIKINIAEIKSGTNESGEVFMTPPESAECVSVDSVSISVPKLDFQDLTEDTIDAENKVSNQERDDVENFLFDPLLPNYVGYEIAKDVIGYDDGFVDPVRFGLDFNLRNEEGFIYIGQRNTEMGYYNPPSQCFIAECALITTTPKGYSIYGEQRISEGKEYTEYFTLIGNTIVMFHSVDWTSGNVNRPEWSNDRIHSFVDSFKKVSDDEVLAVPDGRTNI